MQLTLMSIAMRLVFLLGLAACALAACASSDQPTAAPTIAPTAVNTPGPTRAPLATVSSVTPTALTPSPAATAATAAATRAGPPPIGAGTSTGSAVITTANAANLKLLREFTARQGMVNLALSPDGHTVAIGHDDGTASLLRLPVPLTGEVKPPDILSGHQHEVSDLAFSADGSLLATISVDDDGTLIRDAQTGQSLYKVSGGVSLAFSPDGKQLVVGDSDGKPTLYAVSRAKADKAGTLSADKDEPVCSVGYAAGGTRLVAGYCDYTLGVWDSASRKLTFSLPNVRAFVCATLHCDFLVSNKLALTPTGSLAASVIPDEKVGVWDLSTGKQLTVLAGEGEHLQADGAAFTPEGKLLALSRWNTIFFYDAVTWKLIGQVSVPRTPESAMTQLRFSADGKMLVSGTNGKVQVWGVP